jgi:hypothetical protein
MLNAKDNAKKSFKRVKTEMLGKTGTSEWTTKLINLNQ